MNAQPFYIISKVNPNLAVQAGKAHGSALTLETLRRDEPLQQWVMQAQVSAGVQGLALVNPQTLNSVTSQGAHRRLAMQPYAPNAGDDDTFLIWREDGEGNLRIGLASDPGQFWNDYGGDFHEGDPIYLWSDATVWTIELATARDQVAVPAIVGEPTAATA